MDQVRTDKQRSSVKVTYIQRSHVLVELVLPVSGERREDGVVSHFCTMLQRGEKRIR